MQSFSYVIHSRTTKDSTRKQNYKMLPFFALRKFICNIRGKSNLIQNLLKKETESKFLNRYVSESVFYIKTLCFAATHQGVHFRFDFRIDT